ncbi:hypothetical protein CRD36_17810 [Paremcibacter congregatus]|uniref:HicB-like antitoxin of toxin-antitoxin system domain-containing protein n=1 Tax=Paremcibacter congregatus TaxID=2043170 RepID=A0A2G4YM77_9PROT|nr:hypothetical protein CRD36_17810 [Paremcibacter congregatus]QDE29283.1 hypothetical protein FIV45_12995 [Paremcibacter congregatus]
MKTDLYIAIWHKDPDSDYGVILPDAPGCISAGGILDEARRMATEARALDVAALPDAPPETPGFPE